MPGNKKWNSDWVVLLLRPKGLTIKESRASLNTRNQWVSWKCKPLQIYFFQKKAEVHLKLDLLKSKHPSQMPVETSDATFTEVEPRRGQLCSAIVCQYNIVSLTVSGIGSCPLDGSQFWGSHWLAIPSASAPSLSLHFLQVGHILGWKFCEWGWHWT